MKPNFAMLRQGFRALIALIIIFAIAACTSQADIERDLAHAEAVMEQHPDSALAILQNVDQAKISSPRNNALFALLLTQAKDKNWIDETNDSTIRQAAEYFADHSDRRHKMLSLYYLGRIRYNAEDFAGAMVAYLQALEIAEQDGDHFWAGKSAREISTIYNMMFNAADELKYAVLELDYFKKSNDKLNTLWAIYDLADSHFNNDNYDEGFILSQELFDSLKTFDNVNLETCAYQQKARANLRLKNYSEAVDILQYICENGLATARDSTFLALTYLDLNKAELASSFKNEIRYDDISYDYFSYLYYKTVGQPIKALTALEKVDSLTNDALKGRLSSDFTSTVVRYYEFKDKSTRSELSIIKLRTYWIICTIVLLAIIAGVFARLKIVKQRGCIEQNVQSAIRLRNLLNSSQVDCSKAKNNVRELLASHYDLFDRLCNLIYESNDSVKSRRKISDTVFQLIQQISNDPGKTAELEELINRHDSNLLADFRKDLPNLKEMDYKLFMLSVLGFSTPTKQLLLNTTTSVIYNRKRQLKTKIKSLPAEKSCRYLQYL